MTKMSAREAALKCAECRDTVEILTGEMPDELWQRLSTDRDVAAEALRTVVRQTLEEYESAILAFRDSLPEELETDLHGRLCDLQYKSLTDIANELADIADALDSTNALRAGQIAALAYRVAAACQQPESAPSQVPAQPDSVAQNEEQHPQPASGDKLNPYWMIERGSPAEWWVRGSGRGDGTMLFEEWTRDASKAQHFNEWGARRHAQELESWGVKGPLRATEHLDMVSHPKPHLASGADRALALAERVLDRVNADPDDDLATLARQLLRTYERAETRLAQRLDASHDECCQREASAVQRAEAAEAELAKMRAEREGMVLVPEIASQKMRHAVFKWAQRINIPTSASSYAQKLWADMLAASQPPAEREEPSK